MAKLNPNKIYTNLGEVVSLLNYRDMIYFLYHLGLDYYDGLGTVTKAEWQGILAALRANYTLYEVEKQITYRTFRGNMAAFLNETFRKHPSAYAVMMSALTSFGKGGEKAKLKRLMQVLEEYEAFDNEIAG